MTKTFLIRNALVSAGIASTLVLGACAPLLIGGAMLGSAFVVTDRRTTGTQVEDQSIELKAGSRVREMATLGHVNVTSYNRVLLLTGEVPSADDKARVEAAVRRIEGVQSVVNELEVLGNSSLGTRSSDTVLAGKIKATFIDAKDVQAQAVKVVVERGTVYLMGRVSEREATRAANLARAVGGTQKVVRVFEILSEEELARLNRESPQR